MPSIDITFFLTKVEGYPKINLIIKIILLKFDDLHRNRFIFKEFNLYVYISCKTR